MLRVFDKPRLGCVLAGAAAGGASGLHAARRLAVLAAVLVAACGGATQTREATLNEAFARIQVHEARIDTERAALAHAEATCAARRRAAEQVCGHRDGICGIAREVVDADALARCERASDACVAARGELGAQCEQAGSAGAGTTPAARMDATPHTGPAVP